jgi:hypothetical protein
MPLDTLLDVPAWCNVGQGSFSFGDKGEVVCSPFFFSGTQVGSRVSAMLACSARRCSFSYSFGFGDESRCVCRR